MARNIGDSDRITVSSNASLMNSNTASIMGWFNIPANADFSTFYSQALAFDREMFVRLEDTGTATFWWRTSVGIASIAGSTTFDDGVWHRLLAVRRGAADFELYINEVSQGTSTSNPGTDNGTFSIEVGNQVAAGPLNEGLKGDLARFITLTRAVTPDEAKGILYGAHPGLNRVLWLELGYGSPEPDFSGNAYNGTLTGTTVSNHPPMGYPFWSGIGGISPYVSLFGTASITLDAVTLSATGALAIKGTLSNTLADVTLSSAGALAIHADLSVTLDAVTTSSAATLDITAAEATTLDAITLSSTGIVAIKADATITLDAITLSAAGGTPAQAVVTGDVRVLDTQSHDVIVLDQTIGNVILTDTTIHNVTVLDQSLGNVVVLDTQSHNVAVLDRAG